MRRSGFLKPALIYHLLSRFFSSVNAKKPKPKRLWALRHFIVLKNVDRETLGLCFLHTD